MKLPPSGWVFFAFVIAVLIGYVLNRGIYVGSEIRSVSIASDRLYTKNCKYLFLNGLRDDETKIYAASLELAEEIFCPPLKI
jgi:hypothetical protein